MESYEETYPRAIEDLRHESDTTFFPSNRQEYKLLKDFKKIGKFEKHTSHIKLRGKEDWNHSVLSFDDSVGIRHGKRLFTREGKKGDWIEEKSIDQEFDAETLPIYFDENDPLYEEPEITRMKGKRNNENSREQTRTYDITHDGAEDGA